MLPKALSNLFKKSTAEVRITAVNIKFSNETHTLKGITLTGRVFDYELPFQNKIGNDLLPQHLKGPNMAVGTVKVREPFKLLEISPELPVEVAYMTKIMLKLKIEAPDVNYEGPLIIEVSNDTKETVSMSIKKVSLHHNDKTIDLDDSTMFMPLQKNQIFRKRIQLYKIMEYQGKLDEVTVNTPFEIVSTQPELPIKLDKVDSYILNIYIKAPNFNYAGVLDITFKG